VGAVGESGAIPPEISVALVEDQAATREGLALLIGATPGFRVRGAFASVEAALPALEAEPPDVALFDVELPGVDGIEGVRRLKARRPGVAVLILSVHGDDERVFRAICAGACGYLLKDTAPERLLEAIRELHAGGAPMSPDIARRVVETFSRFAPRAAATDLSPRERDVLRLLADGHSYKTLARELSLSVDTVRFHIRNVYEKLHVHSKSEAVAAALRMGLVR
jgi:DNA-binding NarL/FixJ family response regulator